MYVRSYHVYEAIWRAVVGETVACKRESRNIHDRHAVAVKEDGNTIGHLQRIIYRVCSLLWEEKAAYTILSLGYEDIPPTYHIPSQTALTRERVIINCSNYSTWKNVRV